MILVTALAPMSAVLAYVTPYVNPLGDLSAYDSVDYVGIEDQWDPFYMSYYDAEEDDYHEITVWGNTWHLAVPGDSLEPLHDYLGTLASNVLYTSEEILIAQVPSPSDTWWVYAEYWYDDYYELYVIQEQAPVNVDPIDDPYEEEAYDSESDLAYYADDSMEEGNFSLAPPMINPLGAAEEYAWFGYAPRDRFEIPYSSSRGEDSLYYGWGDLWRMSVDCPDPVRALEELAQYLNELGATINEQSSRSLYASLLDQDNFMWNAFAEAQEGSYYLQVTKERWLVPGYTWQITLDDTDTSLGFGSAPGQHFQTLSIKLDQGSLGLFGDMILKLGDFEQSWSEWMSIESIKTPLYLIDNFPQGLGKITWLFDWEQEPRPTKIEVSISESVPLPALNLGRELGILKVAGADSGEVSVRSSWDVSFTHPDFSGAIGDINAQGEYVFYLPPGYWNMHQWRGDDASIAAKMIPVSAGQITVFTVPAASQGTFKDIANVREIDDALSLSKPVIEGDRGEIEFAIVSEESRGLIPSPESAEISEGGLLGKVLSIEVITQAPSIVLLLDSSGSMRNQMEQTVKAAKSFVSSLSDDTFIQVIDFSTTPEVLKGTTKEEVLRSLDQVKASGATALYDSILEGLVCLEERPRPVLVVFTDGVDANYDDTGPGSVATLPEVRQAVTNSGVPLYTIGFGSGHDDAVLKDLALISGGKYYAATDQNALQKVFTAIQETLSNTYRLVYQRPLEPSISDVPVVSLMIDTSGSMDTSPEEEDCDYRIQKVKNILHDFILDLPEQTLIQVQEFNWFTSIVQSLTLDKASALYAIGALNAAGATDTEGSIQVAYTTLSQTPSQNKVLLYITDAAITTDSPEELDWMFERIANSDFKPVWIGIGMEGSEDIFARVAEKTKGTYLVTEDPNDLSATLEEVLAQIKTKTEESSELTLRLSLKDKGPEDEPRRHIGTIGVDKVQFAQASDVIGPDVATYYAAGTAAAVSESRIYGLTGDELQTRFIPLDVASSNQALAIKVSGATVANNMAGLIAPDGSLFVTVQLELENILPPQEVIVDAGGNSHPAQWMSAPGSSGRKEFMVPQYLIPSLASHLYLGWNNEGMYPVSEISWLDTEGLLLPGDMSLTIHDGQPLKGTLSFMVDGDSMSQISLHFFDTAYGHMNLDLVGEGTFSQLALEEYPQEEPTRLSEVFHLQIVGSEDRLEIGKTTALEGNLFRVIELDLISQVQALLDIDPSEVFWLRIDSEQGAFFLPLHALTSNLPLGFGESRMVAPGSYNKVRLVYELPEELAKHPSALYVDLREDDVILPLHLGGDGQKGTETLKRSDNYVEAEGIRLYINEVAPLHERGSSAEHIVVVDCTLVDEPDGFGTSLEGFLKLVRDDYAGVQSEVDVVKLVTQGGLGDFTDSGEVYYELEPSIQTDALALGLGDAVVKDGESRRGILIFEIPTEGVDHDWTLTSDLFPNLELVISDAVYSQPELVRYRTDFTPIQDGKFAEDLSRAIETAIRRREALQAARGEAVKENRIDLAGTGDGQDKVTPPLLSTPGLVKFEEVTSLDDLLTLLREVQWLPGSGELWQPLYAPEAVLTQMWGTPADLAVLAEKGLQRLEFHTERSVVDLTPEGRERLAKGSSLPLESVSFDTLPAVKYQVDGQERMLVLPFARDISELAGVVEVPIRRITLNEELEMVRIEVSFNVIPTSDGFGSQFADFAAALSGDEDSNVSEPLLVLSAGLALSDLSLDPLDLIYISAGNDQGELFTAILETPVGRVIGQEVVDTGFYEIRGATVEIVLPHETFRHEFLLEEDQRIDQVAQTIAINAPDLPQSSAKILQNVADTMYGSSEKPDSLSVLQWYTRSLINQFIAAQTTWENELAEEMGLTIGRSTIPRIVAVTVKNRTTHTGPQLDTTIDLLQAANQVHSDDVEKKQAFYIASGLRASTLEAKILGQGRGIFEIWSQLPDDTAMIWINEENQDLALEVLKDVGYDPFTLGRIAEASANGKLLIVPLERVLVDGKARAAWLEVDKDTYFSIGVIEGGEHGAMVAQQVIIELYKDFAKYSVGTVVGVDTILWGVASYALIYDDYDTILAAAEEEALAVAQMVKDSIEAAGTLNLGNIKGPREMAQDEAKKLLLPDLSFSAGMAAGILFYLETARQ